MTWSLWRRDLPALLPPLPEKRHGWQPVRLSHRPLHVNPQKSTHHHARSLRILGNSIAERNSLKKKYKIIIKKEEKFRHHSFIIVVIPFLVQSTNYYYDASMLPQSLVLNHIYLILQYNFHLHPECDNLTS